MTTTTPRYPDGAPCWVDLSTPDLAGARRFYGELLGWSFDEPVAEMGHYTTCRRDGKRIAGMAPKQEGLEMPTTWSVYLKTADADDLARRIGAAGGKLVMEPMAIPGQGRMMFGFDPTGAAFGAWEPASHTGAELVNDTGAMCWHEVNTRDGERADGFYRELFGFEQSQIGDGQKFDYTVWSLEGQPICGRLQMDEQWAGLPPHWMTYFLVDRCDESAAKVRELGGKVMHGPFDSAHGRIAVIADPYGAVFSLIDRTKSPSA